MARILVVDDDLQFRNLLCLVLERQGHEVVAVPDGGSAIRVFRQAPAELIITDIIMPEKSGFEVIRVLRNEYPGVKIIAVSGGGAMSAESCVEFAAEFGAQRVLIKPIDHKELLETVGNILGD